MGPDFSCMEWLMNAGATSVVLSDGTIITSRKEMRKFLEVHGFDANNLQTVFFSQNKILNNLRWPLKPKLSRNFILITPNPQLGALTCTTRYGDTSHQST